MARDYILSGLTVENMGIEFFRSFTSRCVTLSFQFLLY